MLRRPTNWSSPFLQVGDLLVGGFFEVMVFKQDRRIGVFPKSNSYFVKRGKGLIHECNGSEVVSFWNYTNNYPFYPLTNIKILSRRWRTFKVVVRFKNKTFCYTGKVSLATKVVIRSPRSCWALVHLFWTEGPAGRPVSQKVESIDCRWYGDKDRI